MLKEWLGSPFTFPIQHLKIRDIFVIKTNLKAHHQSTRIFPALHTDVMLFTTMNVVLVITLYTCHNMPTMNCVKSKYTVSICTYCYIWFYVIISSISCLFLLDNLILIGYRRSYGDCCQNPCPQNCLNGKCDAYTGQCKSCLSGYYGQYCTTGLFVYVTSNNNYRCNARSRKKVTLIFYVYCRLTIHLNKYEGQYEYENNADFQNIFFF